MRRYMKGVFLPIRFIQRSFFRKLLLSFLIIIILTVIGIGIDYYIQTSGQLKKSAISSMERLSEQSTETMESYMSNIRAEAWRYFEDPLFQGFVPNIVSDPTNFSYYSSRLRNFASENEIVDTIVIKNLAGDEMSVNNGYFNNTIKEREFAAKEINRLNELAIFNNGKGVWVLSQVYDSKTGRILNTLAYVQALKKITYLDRKIIGALIIQLNINEFQNWLRNVIGNEQADFFLVDRTDGQIEIRTNQSLSDTRTLKMTSWDPVLQEKKSGYFYSNVGKVDWLIVFKELTGTDWVLVGKVPVKLLLKEVTGFLKRTIIIGFICLIVSMLLASLLSSRVIKPLKRLGLAMKQLETGNYNITVPVETQDEIGYLSQSFNKMTMEINSLIMKVYETELVKKDAEIKALQSQINPHFLYNTLGTIDSLASMYDDSRISIVSSSLAQMLRYIISGGSISTLEAEIGQIQMYLSIQKIRYESRLNYTIEIEDGLERMKLPKLLFQPLVENSIKYGIENERLGGAIRIVAASIDEENVEISVWNSGRPILKTRLKEIQWMLNNEANGLHTSIGLGNIQARLQLIYGSSYGITLTSEEHEGTEFKIKLRKFV